MPILCLIYGRISTVSSRRRLFSHLISSKNPYRCSEFGWSLILSVTTLLQRGVSQGRLQGYRAHLFAFWWPGEDRIVRKLFLQGSSREGTPNGHITGWNWCMDINDRSSLRLKRIFPYRRPPRQWFSTVDTGSWNTGLVREVPLLRS